MEPVGSILQKRIRELGAYINKNKQPKEVKYKCELCQDRGIILLDDSTGKVCDCTGFQKERQDHLFRFLAEADWENFDLSFYRSDKIEPGSKLAYRQLAEQALSSARDFVNQVVQGCAGDGLVIYGPVGSGKTLLAACIARDLIRQGKNVVFLIVPELLDDIKATFYDDENGESKIMIQAKQAEILILDDLGAHNYSEWVRNKLYSIINYRLLNHLPTVVTTNFTLPELDKYIGERTTSRLVQMCKGVKLAVDLDIRYQIRRIKERKKR